MASEIEICNRGLQRLGAKRIVSLTEDSRNGRSCNACYAILRDSELRKHPWNFAIKRVALAKSTTNPVFGRANSFPLPSDFLKLLSLDPEDVLNTEDWQIEGRSIVTDDVDPLYIRYVYRVEDPNEMDSIFRESLSARIAYELAEDITQSNSKKEEAKSAYEDLIFEAKRSNAIERVALVPPEDIWVTVRD